MPTLETTIYGLPAFITYEYYKEVRATRECPGEPAWCDIEEVLIAGKVIDTKALTDDENDHLQQLVEADAEGVIQANAESAAEDRAELRAQARDY